MTRKEFLGAGSVLAGFGFMGLIIISLTSKELVSQPAITTALCILCGCIAFVGIYLLTLVATIEPTIKRQGRRDKK